MESPDWLHRSTGYKLQLSLSTRQCFIFVILALSAVRITSQIVHILALRLHLMTFATKLPFDSLIIAYDFLPHEDCFICYCGFACHRVWYIFLHSAARSWRAVRARGGLVRYELLSSPLGGEGAKAFSPLKRDVCGCASATHMLITSTQSSKCLWWGWNSNSFDGRVEMLFPHFQWNQSADIGSIPVYVRTEHSFVFVDVPMDGLFS